MNREVQEAIGFLASVKSVTHNDFPILRTALQRLLVLGNEEKDITQAIGYIVKVLPVEDIVTKKLACMLLTRFVENIPDVSLLIQNSLRRDFHEPNPMVRSLALKTICACSSQPEDSQEFVSLALKDPSAYVRRTAVLGCIALHHKNHDLVLGQGFVDRLYEMLRDSDPLVVSNALVALNEILEDEGGVVVNHNIAYHLLGQLTSFTEWGLTEVLAFIGKYQPKSEDEIFDFLNVLDQLFESQNCGVVIQVAKLFLSLLDAMPDLHGSVFTRICPRLAVFLNSSTNAELIYLLLIFVHDNLARHKNAFNSLYKSLFCKYREPACIKVKKIEILTQLTTQDNALEVLDEIGMHCTNGSSTVSLAAIAAIGQIARMHSGVFDKFVAKLLELLALEQPGITSHVLYILQDLDLGALADKSELVIRLQGCYDILECISGKCALLSLLGEYGELLPESPDLLERFLDDWSKCDDPRVRHSILATAVKLFFKRPEECQMNLGRLLQISYLDSNDELRNQAHFYYTLLVGDAKLLQQIVQGSLEDKKSKSHTV